MAAILKLHKIQVCQPPMYEVESTASSISRSKSRFLPSRISSKAYLPTSKVCLLQSIKPWIRYFRKVTWEVFSFLDAPRHVLETYIFVRLEIRTLRVTDWTQLRKLFN